MNRKSFISKIRSVVVFLLAVLIASTAYSQGVQQLSDQQIMMLAQQAKMAGMSDTDLLNMLSKQGFSTNDINNFKKRLTKLQNPGLDNVGESNSTIVKRDSSWIKEIPLPTGRLTNYGYDFFNSPTQTFQPNLNAPTPKNYILGPNDELIISLTGLNETTVRDQISLDGNLNIPYAGFVNLSGLTMEQATERIRSKMSVPYPALRMGRTQLFVTLGNVRSIRVSVIGEANFHGTYTVSALASFFNVLYASGGPSANGSLRKIELIRNNKVINTIDFYSFLQKGLLENIRLEDQDIIRYPVYEKRVTVSGEVKRPAVYELKGRETLAELLGYAGGFSEKAYRFSVKLVEIGPQEKRVKDISASDFENYIPKNGDSLYVGAVIARYENRVIINGAVNRPGTYELKQDLTLKKLIQTAEGIRTDVFLNRGYLDRVSASGERTILSFSLDKILNGTEPDIKLLREDSIYIYSKDELKSITSITVGGAVRNPGAFPYREGMTAEDIIAMAGGFTINAATHKVEISRLEKNTADTLANQMIRLFTVNVDSALSHNNSQFGLQPLDYVFVPELLNYRVLGNIKIRGEILYPGDYTLERRDESVIELIRRAGGVSPFASVKDAQVYRKGLRIGTDVLSETNNKKDPFLLLPGDSIYIPRNQSFVEVSGAVFNPQIVDYTTNRFKYYISSAGGVTDNGKLSRAYILYTNGINRKTKHFLFFRTYPKVKPGSKIIVPEKTLMDLKPKIGVGEISAATAILTALVTLFTVIKK